MLNQEKSDITDEVGELIRQKREKKSKSKIKLVGCLLVVLVVIALILITSGIVISN